MYVALVSVQTGSRVKKWSATASGYAPMFANSETE